MAGAADSCVGAGIVIVSKVELGEVELDVLVDGLGSLVSTVQCQPCKALYGP